MAKSYLEFKRALKDYLEGQNPECEIREDLVRKMGEEFEAFSIIPTVNGNHRICSTIRIRECYEEYLEKESLKEWEAFCEIAEKANEMTHKVPKIDLKNITESEAFRKNVFLRLANEARNSEMLKNAPHRNYMGDICLCYYVYLGCGENDQYACALINNSLMEENGLSENELYELAISNSPSLFEKEIAVFGSAMTIVTNSVRTYGASCIAYPNMLEEIAQKVQDDYFILPSSIHELIVVPAKTVSDTKSLFEMVYTINRDKSLLPPQDFLSDKVFYYHTGLDSPIEVVNVVS